MEPGARYLSSSSAPGELRGAKGRLITGGLNIAFGIADVVIPTIMIAVGPSRGSGLPVSTGVAFGTQPLLLGISFIILSITAGCLGIYSRGRNCQAVTYLVLCVVLAIFTAAGSVYSALLCIAIRSYADLDYVYYESDLGTIHIFLIINTIVNALHCVVAITGASFTCGAVCCIPDTRDPQQPMYFRPVVMQPPPQKPMDVAGAVMPPAYTHLPSHEEDDYAGDNINHDCRSV